MSYKNVLAITIEPNLQSEGKLQEKSEGKLQEKSEGKLQINS